MNDFSSSAAYSFKNRHATRCPFAVILLAVLVLSGLQPARAQLATTAVYVGNQGNFSDANGSVSIYIPSTGEVIADGIPDLNTLVQSITLDETRGFIAANTSDRIDVIDLSTNTRIGQITGVSSPRYVAFVGEDKGYVSNLFDNSITILDLAGNTIVGTIPVGSNPEDIAVVGDMAFVANNGFGFDSTLTRIDVTTGMAAGTLDLGCDGPRFLEVDGQDELWVVCNGKTVYNDDFTEIIEQTNGQVLVVDIASAQILQRFELDEQAGAASGGQDAHYDPVTDRVFVVQGNQILVFDTTSNGRLESIVISGDEPIGAVAFDAAAGRLYLARITDFTSAGFVSIHDLDGMEVDRFDVGIAPTTIALLQTGTSVAAEDLELPGTFAVRQNYPNPFSTATTISFDNPRPGTVAVKIYDMLGREVATPVDGTFPAGTLEIVVDAEGLPGGAYFYRVSAGGFEAVRQMTLLK